jgi:hypothetical protein
VNPDGGELVIGGSEGVVAFDTASTTLVTAATTPEAVTGLAYADDGALFVSWNGGIARLDASTLRTREVMASPVTGELEMAGSAGG